MKARDLMTPDPVCCTPADTVEKAAQLVSENDCGCVPVVEDLETKKIVGTITDRDIACRCVGEGKGPQTTVRQAMSEDPNCCRPEDDIRDVERIMAERQVRRVPVIDDQGCCVGMIAQSDLAREEMRRAANVVKDVSQPTAGSRTNADVCRRPEAR